MSTAKSNAERQREWRQRNKQAAKEQITEATEVRALWANPDDHPAIRAKAASLARTRAKLNRKKP